MTKDTVRIGCFSAFWGDSSTGAAQLVKQGGHLDYLVGDYLSEVTMGLLARIKTEQQAKGTGNGGYVAEFVHAVWKPLMKDVMKKNIKIITNAGGMDPLECKKAIEKVAQEANIQVSVAAISGDDLIQQLPALQKSGTIVPFETEGEKDHVPTGKKIISANAYFGAYPIVKALQAGAQVIVTGRCSDSALVLAPLMHEFGWQTTDYDLLAAGSVAGHIIECGCQATGGNFTDWELSSSFGWDNVGFPIVDCYKDGSFIVSKPENTGGVVNRATVAEQMLYEIGDPSSYLLPDVIVDFRSVTLEQVGNGKVLVKNAKGRAPTPNYKVSVTYFDGFKISAQLLICGVDAAKKAQAIGNALLVKTSKLLQAMNMKPYEETNLEVIGAEHLYGANARTPHAREVMLRIAMRHANPKALEVFARELAPCATSMAPGITGGGEGRPRPTPLLGYTSCLIAKSAVPVTLTVGSDAQKVDMSQLPSANQTTALAVAAPVMAKPTNLSGTQVFVPLIALANGRSGDKGDICNIGILARKPEYFPLLKQALTSEAVHKYLSHLIRGKVSRYELPGSLSFNFVCTKALGGGGLHSLAIDRQGKCYAQLLLDFQVLVPIEWAVPSASKL